MNKLLNFLIIFALANFGIIFTSFWASAQESELSELRELTDLIEQLEEKDPELAEEVKIELRESVKSGEIDLKEIGGIGSVDHAQERPELFEEGKKAAGLITSDGVAAQEDTSEDDEAIRKDLEKLGIDFDHELTAAEKEAFEKAMKENGSVERYKPSEADLEAISREQEAYEKYKDEGRGNKYDFSDRAQADREAAYRERAARGERGLSKEDREAALHERAAREGQGGDYRREAERIEQERASRGKSDGNERREAEQLEREKGYDFSREAQDRREARYREEAVREGRGGAERADSREFSRDLSREDREAADHERAAREERGGVERSERETVVREQPDRSDRGEREQAERLEREREYDFSRESQADREARYREEAARSSAGGQ